MQPVHAMEDKQRWNALVRAHHYLPWHRLFGKALHHVAVHDDRWLALIGWQVGAFRTAARDRWIGWSPEQQFSRLHLVANNARHVLLGRQRRRNLASRVLELSLARPRPTWRRSMATRSSWPRPSPASPVSAAPAPGPQTGAGRA